MGRGSFKAKKRVREGANVAEREAGILFDAPSLAANAPAAACSQRKMMKLALVTVNLKHSCLWHVYRPPLHQ